MWTCHRRLGNAASVTLPSVDAPKAVRHLIAVVGLAVILAGCGQTDEGQHVAALRSWSEDIPRETLVDGLTDSELTEYASDTCAVLDAGVSNHELLSMAVEGIPAEYARDVGAMVAAAIEYFCPEHTPGTR